MVKAVIYARVSTDDQRGNYSISTQVKSCLDYIISKEYELVGNQFVDSETGLDSPNGTPAFVDDISSGITNRPGLDSAYSYLQNYGFDVVVIYSLDRLARDPQILTRLKYGFMRDGANVEYVLTPVTNDTMGEWQESNIAYVARLENEWRTERTNRGKRKKARSNLFVSGIPPYGYKIDKTQFGGLSVIEPEAEVIRKVFNLYASEGYSVYQIVNWLNENKIKPRKSKKWGKSSVLRILNNTGYIGLAYYNKNKRVQVLDENGQKQGKFKLVEREQEDWIEYRIPAIVDQNIFQEVIEKINFNREHVRKTPKRNYLLSGHIFCEDCGKAFIAQTKRPTNNNRLTNETQSYRHRIRAGHCRNMTISANEVEPIVWDQIVNVLLNPDSIRMGYENSKTNADQNNKNFLISIEAYKVKLEKLTQTLNNLNRAYIDPDIPMSKEEYNHQRDTIQSEMRLLEGNIKALEKQLSKFPTEKEVQNIEDFAGEIKTRLTDEKWKPSLRNKKEILKMLKVRVLVDQNRKITVLSDVLNKWG